MSDHGTRHGLSGAETLSLLKIGLMSDGELHPDSPVEGRGVPPFLFNHDPSKIIGSCRAIPTDRGLLLLLALSDSPEAPEQR